MSARDVIADAAVWCSAHDDVGRYRDADMILARLSAAGLVVVETALLREMADDLAEHIAAHYGGSVGYPGMDRKRNRDMEPVNRARAMLAAVEAGHD